MIEHYKNGQLRPSDEGDFLARIAALEYAREPAFSDRSAAILESLSKRLLSAAQARAAPQLTALGFWLRRSRLAAMRDGFARNLPSSARSVARGIAFHLPSQNVDTLFVYSWALSLLAGNVNVVRLPAEMPPVLGWLMQQVEEVLAEHEADNRQFFCRYPHTSQINAQLSALADLRVIWGGDDKVRAVSADPVRPDGLSVGFPDRKSFSILGADAYRARDDGGRDALAGQLYNDIFWFDQMGCGSPRILFWLGDAGDVAHDLYARLDKVAEGKAYGVETGVALNKLSFMNELVACNAARNGTRFSNRLSVLSADLGPHLVERVQGGGMLIDVHLANITEIAPMLDRQTQTITHFGLDAAQLEDLARIMSVRGGFRLVPVGEALSFAEIWDGLPLLGMMTRQISVQGIP